MGVAAQVADDGRGVLLRAAPSEPVVSVSAASAHQKARTVAWMAIPTRPPRPRAISRRGVAARTSFQTMSLAPLGARTRLGDFTLRLRLRLGELLLERGDAVSRGLVIVAMRPPASLARIGAPGRVIPRPSRSPQRAPVAARHG